MKNLKGILDFVSEAIPWALSLAALLAIFGAGAELDGVGHTFDNKCIQYALFAIFFMLAAIFLRMTDFMDLLTKRMKADSGDKTN